MGVRDPGSDPEFLCGCKRPGERSRNFCVDIRGSKCRPKSSIAQEIKTHGHGYHPDLELSDRSRERLGMKTHEHGYHPDLELSDRSRE